MPSPQEVRDKVLQSSSSSELSAIRMSSVQTEILKEINDKVLQNWQQIESDLKVTVEMHSDHVLAEQSEAQSLASVSKSPPLVIKVADLSESEMERLVTLKSRSLKQLSNKQKHMRNKVKVSLSKNKHNYSLRGMSLQ